jgi:hypothetical protein
MGRFDQQRAQSADGPDIDAKRVYLETQAMGGDAYAASRGAWKAGMARLGQRLYAPGYQPADPGEGNLLKAAQHLIQTQKMDPLIALATAHEFLARMAEQPPRPPPGGPPPPMQGGPGG